jgi:hypothetical protein
VLLRGGRWAFAYYVAGYAVECGLKSCVLSRMVHTGWVFDQGVTVASCQTHDFLKLIEACKLKDELNEKLKADKEFTERWAVARKWNSSQRYAVATEEDAGALYEAITHEQFGVLTWIRKHW